jgi:hypothetical protein
MIHPHIIPDHALGTEAVAAGLESAKPHVPDLTRLYQE